MIHKNLYRQYKKEYQVICNNFEKAQGESQNYTHHAQELLKENQRWFNQ